MQIEPNQLLLHYRLIEPIGSGGMGEVWKAIDTSLDREVAIKILPNAFATDPERLARFEREAKLLASLNHTNIAAVYGLHDAGPSAPSASSGQAESSIHFLAMELVPGEDLSARIERGSIPVDEAVAIAKQIAEALEVAHEQGVIHRDLKPANVRLTPEGAAKVLDFGLAKALRPDASEASTDPSLSPTMTSAGSIPGMILGTASYMSPEQARGQAVDRRADIWSFGCVLYEMLVGSRVFKGETISDSLASILAREPDWDALPVSTPPALRTLLERCLTKDARMRLRDVGEARILLEGDLEPMESVERSPGSTGAPVTSTARGRGWIWATLGLLIGAALVAMLWSLSGSETPEAAITMRSRIDPPENGTFMMRGDFGGAPVISPDGTRLAFVAIGEDRQNHVWIRSLQELTPHIVQETQGAYAPFWSPNGRSIGFFADNGLRVIDLDSGSLRTLAPVTQGKGGSWNEDDVIVFTPNFSSALLAVPAAGGDARQVTKLEPPLTTNRWPQFLPDQRQFIYFAGSHDDLEAQRQGVYVGSLDGGDSRFLFESDSNAIYADGRLLFVRDGGLVAYPFDPESARLLGVARSLSDRVQVDESTWRVNMSAVAETLIFQPVGESASDGIRWVDRSGNELDTIAAEGTHLTLRLSPNGRFLVTETAITPNSDIWIQDLERGTRTKLTLNEADDGRPVWSPDGKRIVFQSNRGDGTYRLYEKPASGARPAQPILGTDSLLSSDGTKLDLWPLDWSRDGRFLLITEGVYGKNETGRAMSVLDVEGRPERIRLVTSEGALNGRFSPDGRWVAFSIIENGKEEVFVAPFDPTTISAADVDATAPLLEGAPRWQISFGGGNRPLWNDNGKELIYARSDNAIISVEVTSESDSFKVGASRPLFVAPIRLLDYSYDLSGDGQRFVLSAQAAGSTTPLVMVSDWAVAVGDRE